MKHFLEFKTNAETWVRDDAANPFAYYWYGLVLTRMGEKDKAWEAGIKIIETDTTAHRPYAEFLASYGKTDEALDQLEKALRAGYREMIWLKLSPDFYFLHDDDRYKSLIKKYFGEH